MDADGTGLTNLTNNPARNVEPVWSPDGSKIAFVRHGQIYIMDTDGAAAFSGDGGPASRARLNDPYGVAVDASGNFFIADTENNRIRRVDGATGIITTVAGDGTAGFSGDGGAAASASLNRPFGAALDALGNLFIAAFGNHRIRKVDLATGIITTVAGDGITGFNGDGGPAADASLEGPPGVAVDELGNLLIADSGNHRIRKVDVATGIITTVAGNGTAGFSGDSGPADQCQPLRAPRRVSGCLGQPLYRRSEEMAESEKWTSPLGSSPP